MNTLPIKTSNSFEKRGLPVYLSFDKNIPAWNRQEGEPADAYSAFVAYCEIPPEEKRSYIAIAEKMKQPADAIEQWALRWRWALRASAYDKHLIRAEVEELKRERIKSLRKHVALARAFQNKVITRLNALNPDELSPGDLVKWVDIAGKIERQALSEPSDDWNGGRAKNGRS
jgi:hypothetical protein